MGDVKRRLSVFVVFVFISTTSPAFASGAPADEPQSPNTSTGKGQTHFAEDHSTWKSAFADSLRLLAIEHAWRIATQPQTRRELGGPFLADYRGSVRWPKQWDDTDPDLVNYVGHPIHGAAAGRTWINNSPGARFLDVGFSKTYWTSRAHATAWSAFYSVMFEFGPISEASLGNVGLNPEANGWVDHVVTPAGAFGILVAEDVLDRYLVQWVDRRTGNRVLRAAVRITANPARALANMAEGHLPWYRDRGGLACCR